MNDAPVAQNDAVTVSEDVPFSSSISLLANDSDVDGDSLSVVARPR
ncbi:Ig-like domain-containing protein [Pseudomonas stutzeri]|nr:Ig-like domain-containing protein [Stutzerimonas stutzeri]